VLRSPSQHGKCSLDQRRGESNGDVRGREIINIEINKEPATASSRHISPSQISSNLGVGPTPDAS
jgi:hypothetical protein